MPIETARLILRPWLPRDLEPFTDMSADADVMAYLLPIATREAAQSWIGRQMASQEAHGFCFWAAEQKESGAFVGAIGLYQVGYDAHFTPAIEVGWRVAPAFWGRGYALEAAIASMRFGFDVKGLSEIVANAAVENTRSRRVMAKLGMSHDPADDFDHPRVPDGHKLRRQVLYRLCASQRP